MLSNCYTLVLIACALYVPLMLSIVIIIIPIPAPDKTFDFRTGREKERIMKFDDFENSWPHLHYLDRAPFLKVLWVLINMSYSQPLK